MFQFILDQSLKNNRVGSRLFRYLIQFIVKYYDPVVRYNLNGRQIALNLSHQLPWYRSQFPTYSANLARLAMYIRAWRGALCMIDVGANIGDSYCLVGSKPGDEYLLIEGSRHYFDLLTANTRDARSVTLVQAFISDRPVDSADGLHVEGGTARVVKMGETSECIHYHTLDEIVEFYPKFRSANLLKTDVDGHDSRAIMGGRRFIAAAMPVIFFEHHPRLLALAGDNDIYIFDVLAELGYRKLILYDNYGFLIGTVGTEQSDLLRDLVFYARQKNGYYYDVCCFNDRHAQAREEFLSLERTFYSDLLNSAR